MVIHLALIVINDILLIALKKAHDKFIDSQCRSSCCSGISQAACCMRYVEQKSAKANRVMQRLDSDY